MPPGKRTVRDFKKKVEDQIRIWRGGVLTYPSDRHEEFWEKLNGLGARNIEKLPPTAVPDIDSTVELSDEEWAELEAEFNSL